jgi:hypothetical protein
MRGALASTLLIGLWMLIGTGAAQAQAVRVTSGEHDGFSRIVLQFSGPVDWQLQRTEAGYALSVPSDRPRYDLTDVFRLIPRDRLAAIFADPDTGVLNLNVGCACHALPFELRPGLVVIDIRDGAAPQGASFERMADGGVAPPLRAITPRRPLPRPEVLQAARAGAADTPLAAADPALDWRRDLLAAARVGRPPGPPLAAETDEAALREALLLQLGRGAAEGVVDFRDMGAAAPAPVRRIASDLDRHLNIGPEPGLDAEAGRRVPGMLTAEGATCLTDEALDLASWTQDGETAAAMGLVRSALLVEFDQPDAAAVATAVRYFLHLGFGAEARDLIRHFAPDAPERELWHALADVLDGNPVVRDPFRGMESCDSAAALWAVLAGARPVAAQGMDRAAILRSFSALPLHLRRHLGPQLAAQFRDGGDESGAASVRDAILRAPGESGAGVLLMEAERHLTDAGSDAALPLLDPLIAGSGPTAIEATVRLITAQAMEGKTVEDALITTAEAFFHEAKGSDRSVAIARALALGLASQARLTEALGLPQLSDETRRTVWDIFASKAGDDRFLAATVGAEPEHLQTPVAATKLAIGARLNALGLHQAALEWVDGSADPAFRMVRAQARRGLRDWRGVLVELAGLPDEAALRLRAEAMAALNDPGVLTLMDGLDDADARRAVARRLGAWPELLEAPAQDPWTSAVQLVAGDDPVSAQAEGVAVPQGEGDASLPVLPDAERANPSLEAARQRIAESRAARESIAALLLSVQQSRE